MDLAGKVAFVTGGGSGIGEGLAQAFAEKGMAVVVADIVPERAEAVAAALGNNSLALAIDVTSLDSWSAARERAIDRFGQVDVLCNNAGVALPFLALEDVSPEAFDRVMAVNVRGVYNGCVTFIPEMKARRSGHIVNTSSLNGQLPYQTFATYCASKFAVAGLSETLRLELEPFGVGVSILYPGLTRSRMSEAQVPDLPADAVEALRGRMMEPIWLGRAVVLAVEVNEQHIITHPDALPALQARLDALVAAYGEPAQPGYEPARLSGA